LARSRTAPARAVARARVLVAYADGASCPAIARTLGIPLPTVMRGVKKALALGPRRAVEDLPRAGRPPRITPRSPGLDHQPGLPETQRSGVGLRVLE